MDYFQYTLSFQAVGFTMMAGAIFVAVFKPYKNSLHNMQDSVILLSGALVYLSLVADSYIGTLEYSHISMAGVVIILSLVFLDVATSASFFWNPAARIVRKVYTVCSSSSGSRELLANSQLELFNSNKLATKACACTKPFPYHFRSYNLHS